MSKLSGVVNFKAGDGTDRAISLNVNAIIDIEEELGKDFHLILEELNKKPSRKLMRCIFYHGLKACDPSMTLEEAGKLMSFGFKVGPVVIEAVIAAFPSNKKESDETTKNPK